MKWTFGVVHTASLVGESREVPLIRYDMMILLRSMASPAQGIIHLRVAWVVALENFTHFSIFRLLDSQAQ